MSDHSPSRAPIQPLVAAGGSDLHQRDMTATFSADMPLQLAQAQLGEIGQWLPIDGDPARPLGSLVETNSTGPLRLGYGAWRDLLLGVQFANGRGKLITAGGRTVKNVAGYDLTKLMVGQGGALGRIVTVTTRTYSRPVGGLLAVFPPDPSIVARLMPTPLRPQWAMLLPAALYCGYLGDEAALGFYRDRLGNIATAESRAGTLQEDTQHRAPFWVAGRADTFRASIPPSRLLDFVKSLEVKDWAADAVFATVVGSASPGPGRQAIHDLAVSVGGKAWFYNAPTPGDEARTAAFEFSTNPVEQRIIDRLKAAFDPEVKLSPCAPVPPLPWKSR